MSGGVQNFYTFQFLESQDEQNIPTVKTAVTMTLTVADDPEQAYVSIVETADQDQNTRVQRFNLSNGDSILMNSIVSITQVPAMTVNQLMTREISLALQGRIQRYFAVTV
jgi:co-chaperonin GroES (HSP10)